MPIRRFGPGGTGSLGPKKKGKAGKKVKLGKPGVDPGPKARWSLKATLQRLTGKARFTAPKLNARLRELADAPRDPRTLVRDAMKNIAGPGTDLRVAKGCGCMGMPQDPKTAVLGALNDIRQAGRTANFAKGCGCMGMPQDPKTSVLGAMDLINRPGPDRNVAAGCGCMGMAQDPKTSFTDVLR